VNSSRPSPSPARTESNPLAPAVPIAYPEYIPKLSRPSKNHHILNTGQVPGVVLQRPPGSFTQKIQAAHDAERREKHETLQY
jgi:hypothetical protein